MSLKDYIRAAVHYDEHGVEVEVYINLHKKIEINIDTLNRSSIDLIQEAKEHLTNLLIEEIENDL